MGQWCNKTTSIAGNSTAKRRKRKCIYANPKTCFVDFMNFIYELAYNILTELIWYFFSENKIDKLINFFDFQLNNSKSQNCMENFEKNL